MYCDGIALYKKKTNTNEIKVQCIDSNDRHQYNQYFDETKDNDKINKQKKMYDTHTDIFTADRTKEIEKAKRVRKQNKMNHKKSLQFILLSYI